jgi:hypothetical protein
MKQTLREKRGTLNIYPVRLAVVCWDGLPFLSLRNNTLESMVRLAVPQACLLIALFSV